MSAPQTPHRFSSTAPRDHPAEPQRSATAALRGLQVLVVGPDYAPHSPDATPYTTAIAEHLATAADGVTVLTAVPQHADGRIAAAYGRGLRTADPGWFALDDPRVIRLRRYSPRHRTRPGPGRLALHELSFLLNATSAGRRLPADLVIGITPGPGGAAAASWLAARHAAPLITVVQALAPLAASDGDIGRDARGRLSRVGPALEGYAVRRSTQVAVASETFRGPLLAAGVGLERLHLLPVWSRVAPSALSRAAARQELGWPSRRFVAVHAGPLGHQQDGGTIVEAARLLAGPDDDRHAGGPGFGNGDIVGPEIEGPEIDVVLVGDGSQRAALEQQAFGVPTVRFLEPVDDDTLPLVLAAADVLIVAERFPAGTATASGQLAGYLGAGRPVVAAAWVNGPTAALLRRCGGAGVRVDPQDPAALAGALLELRSAGSRRAAMGRAGLRYARAHLGHEAFLSRLDAIVEAALDPSAGRPPLYRRERSDAGGTAPHHGNPFGSSVSTAADGVHRMLRLDAPTSCRDCPDSPDISNISDISHGSR